MVTNFIFLFLLAVCNRGDSEDVFVDHEHNANSTG